LTTWKAEKRWDGISGATPGVSRENAIVAPEEARALVLARFGKIKS
jgi:hypothetical protein